LPISAARAEIQLYSGRQFDPDVVQIFMTQPERIWLELHENVGDPFRLAQLDHV
jgi:response regulator RpfG family c-di-GMP phosphodiesterase